MASELIAQLTSASEDDRELDIAIGLAVNPGVARWHPEWWSGGAEYLRWPDKPDGEAVYDRCPFFTSDIDAALTLIPEGWNWLVRSPSENALRHKAKHFAHIDRLPEDDGDEVGYGANGAIAICIAALKARQALTPPNTAQAMAQPRRDADNGE